MTQAPEAALVHEVFPNAPLQLVAVEVTCPATELPFDPGLFPAVQEVLGGQADTQLAGQVRMSGQPDPDGRVPAEAMLFRMTNAARTVSISAWPTSLVVECSEYERFEIFRGLVHSVVDAYAGFRSPSAVTRFGMRYIDEMHVPTPISTVADWAPYVSEMLLAPSALVREAVTSLATGFTVDLGAHRSLNVRCTTTPGRALSSEGHLRLRPRPDTPALVLDIDAVYEPPQPEQTPVTGEVVASLADGLRAGVRQVFDAVFTEQARDTFRIAAEEPA